VADGGQHHLGVTGAGTDVPGRERPLRRERGERGEIPGQERGSVRARSSVGH
jgi:hypothetical protein